MTTELTLTKEQIEKFRRVAKTEFAGIRADQVCDQALAAIDLQAEVESLREALQKLACLGNGDVWGNSVGNVIAQAALQRAGGKEG